MKKLIMLINIIILFSLLFPTTSAKSSELFKDYLTNLMWEDCKGKDIHINQPIIINTATNQTVSLIKWQEYDKEGLRRIIDFIDGYTYWDYLGPIHSKNKSFLSSGIDGCDILTCENNCLDIDLDTYYWKNTKVDVPKEELLNIASGNNNTQVINKGDKNSVVTGNSNIVNTGDESIITQQDLNFAFAKGTILGAIIVFLLNILYDFWGKGFLNRLFKKR